MSSSIVVGDVIFSMKISACAGYNNVHEYLIIK